MPTPVACALRDSEVVSTPLQGFGSTAADYDFRIEHTGTRVGVRMTADRPLANAALWSMRTTIAVEPFLAIAIDPGLSLASPGGRP